MPPCEHGTCQSGGRLRTPPPRHSAAAARRETRAIQLSRSSRGRRDFHDAVLRDLADRHSVSFCAFRHRDLAKARVRGREVLPNEYARRGAPWHGGCHLRDAEGATSMSLREYGDQWDTPDETWSMPARDSGSLDLCR